jgi:membrane associated rhomboid family serine protease
MPMTVALIAANVVGFGIEIWLELRTDFPLAEKGALHLGGLQRGYWWQLLTFQFLHAGWLHLLLNCWGIFVFGPPIESILGKWRLLALYLLSGVAGGALQVFASTLSFERFGGPVVGASAGVFGLVAAFTSLYPDARLVLLLFFFIPVRMTANRMLTIAGLITAVGIMFPNRLLGANVAHVAHLGGLIGGLIFVRLFTRQFRTVSP